PQPEVKADDTNPRGFSEPRWVVDFHTRLMRERRVTVFDSRPAAWESTAEATRDDAAFEDLRSWLAVQFVGTDNVIAKDPRIVWFLPLWLRCAEDLGIETSFATMLRQPAEVVRSASRWYGEWQNDASRAAAWLNVTLHSEQATRGARRAFIRYDDLLEDWGREIARVGDLLDVPWLVDLERSSHPEVDAFVDPGLRRSTVGWDEVPVPSALREQVDHAWELASGLARRGGDDEAARAALDDARAAYLQLYAEAEAITQSSVTAVKPRRRRTSLGGVPRAKGSSPSPSRLRVLARIIPSRHRERIAASGGLGTLPLRLALLVPVRYRERVPLPVVRAGLRLMRGLRRI
ncbi:MAG: hypothetical protein ACRDNG_00830, partial [Gaiellaceae bacterium]